MFRFKSKLESSANRPAVHEREALEWLARLDRGLTLEQELEFERWLAAHPQHAEAFGEFDGTLSLLNRVHETPEAAAAAASGRADPDVFASRRRGWRALPRSVFGLAAAAALAVGVFGWWQKQAVSDPHLAFSLVASSDSTEIRKLDLPDGSVLQLNRDSSVDVRFTARERRVRLMRGEAHFTVSKNPARPFVVTASAVDVRAIGTAFNVRLQPEAVEVLVTEGKVRVHDERGRSLLANETPDSATGSPTANDVARSSASSDRALIAGEMVTIGLATKSIAVPARAASVVLAATEIDRVLAWQKRNLEFVSAPLSEMVAEFNRHNRQQLVIDDLRLAQQRFGGTFRTDDLAGFVRVLETHFGVVAERSEEKIVLRSAP